MNQRDSEPEDKKAPDTSSTGPTDEITLPPEVGGPKGLEPTRYGDWERNGRCYDF